MSTLAASNLDEPPPEINQQPLLSLFSLPNDIVLDIVARVPKRYYLILSCVSKKFQVLVRSHEIQDFRSFLGKDSLYVCFFDRHAKTCSWFTLRRIEKNMTKNLFIKMDLPPFPASPGPEYSVIAVGEEIFFIGGASIFPSSSMWIFDSRSGKYRRGPNMRGSLLHSTAVLVSGGKIYVIGRDKNSKIRAEFFDLKTQTWKPVSIPKGIRPYILTSQEAVALDKKVCWLNSRHIAFYDTRDGTYGFANNGNFPYKGPCVIDNVLYIYDYYRLGLMWYDSKLRQWRKVNGLDHLKNTKPIGMAEYYGKLAYMWTGSDSVDGSETKEIWCRMIALEKSEVGIHGTAEPSQLLGIIPRIYSLRKCLSLG